MKSLVDGRGDSSIFMEWEYMQDVMDITHGDDFPIHILVDMDRDIKSLARDMKV